MLKLSLYTLAAISILGNAFITPALGVIKLYFADANPILIQLILTMPALLVIPTSFFIHPLCVRFGKKKVVLTGLFIFAVFGTLAGTVSNIWLLILLRGILGIGIGLISPISQSFPSDFFSGTEKEQVIARQSSSITFGKMIGILLAGWLAYFSWRYAFLTYLIAIPIFIFVYLYIPNETNKKIEKDDVDKNSEKLPFMAHVYILSMFFYMICLYGYLSHISIIIEERNLGSPALSGYILAIGNFLGFLIAFNFNTIHRYLKRYTILIVPFSICFCFLFVSFAYSIPMLILSAVFNAAYMGVMVPAALILISETVNQHMLVKAMSYLTLSMFLGQFVSPIIIGVLPTFVSFEESIAPLMTIALISGIFGIGLMIYFTSLSKILSYPHIKKG